LFGSFNVTPLAVVPLVANDTTWGVLVVGKQDKTDEIIAENNQQLLTYLAQHLARSLRQLHLSDRAKRHADTIYSLNQIAHTITSSLDIDDVIQKTMAGINATLDVEAGSLLLLDENTKELYFKITLRGENKQITSYRLQPDEGVAGWVVTNNQPTVVNNAASDSRFSNKIDKAIGFKTRTLLCTPLVVQGNPIGALEVINKRSGLFTKIDLDLLVSMAASLGIALKNALLYDSAQERAQQNEIINQITAAINAGRGLSETARYIFMQFDQRFSFDSMTLSLMDRPSTKIRQWALSERGAKEYRQTFIPLENSRLATIIKRGHGYIESDITQAAPANKHFPDDQIDLKNGAKSRITVPLITQNTPFGCFGLGSQKKGAFGLRELKLLDELAPHLAMVTEKALLLDDMERRANELHLLNRLSEMLAASIDAEIVVETALNMLPRILPNDIHGIIITDEIGAHIGLVVPTNFKNSKDVIREMVDTLNELVENGALEISSTKTIAGNLPVSKNWKPITKLFLPILARRVPQGIIYTASGKKEHLSDDFLRIFSLFVSQITAAVQNAHLFQQVEKERARLAAILASSTDAVLVVDRNGLIVLDNPAVLKIFDVTESQSGRLLSKATSLESLVNLFNSAMRGGKTTGEVQLMDGRTFFANLSPVSVEEFGVIGWVATMQDVSHFKELDQIKDDFVSTVSHDLRSPLSSILIATKMVDQIGEVNDEQRKLLDLVERRVDEMTQLSENLLDVGRIEAGIDMELEPCNMEQVVIDVTDALQPQADEKNLQLTVTFADSMPPGISQFLSPSPGCA